MSLHALGTDYAGRRRESGWPARCLVGEEWTGRRAGAVALDVTHTRVKLGPFLLATAIFLAGALGLGAMVRARRLR